MKRKCDTVRSKKETKNENRSGSGAEDVRMWAVTSAIIYPMLNESSSEKLLNTGQTPTYQA